MKSAFIRVLCISALSVLGLFPARAEKEGLSREQAEALVSGLKYQQGEIALQNGLATLHVPDGFRFLNGTDAQTVLVKLWGNPPRSADPQLGRAKVALELTHYGRWGGPKVGAAPGDPAWR